MILALNIFNNIAGWVSDIYDPSLKVYAMIGTLMTIFVIHEKAYMII